MVICYGNPRKLMQKSIYLMPTRLQTFSWSSIIFYLIQSSHQLSLKSNLQREHQGLERLNNTNVTLSSSDRARIFKYKILFLHVLSHKMTEIFYKFSVFEILYIFYTFRTPQFRLAILQGAKSHSSWWLQIEPPPLSRWRAHT